MTKDNRLKILQVGSSDWSENQEIPENMKWYYCNLGQLETLQETIEEDEINASQRLWTVLKVLRN
ncbi:MAG: hypothetical protein ACLTZB_05470 [Streptococcus salivarius]